jgi:NAD(P)-dependent dehydrogenase (short-subunit alcohol dehydrogenase family)
MNAPYELTKDGYESQLAVCHIAHFLLFKKLQTVLLSSSTPAFNSRVINVSSVGHNWGQVDLNDLNFMTGRKYDGWASYGQAKTANIWMANHIDKLYGFQGLHACSVHPGSIASELQRHTTNEEWIKFGIFNEQGNYDADLLWKSAGQGAATSVWAATAPELEGKGGLYLEDIYISETTYTGGTEGYSSWAFDEEGAAKLWDWTEQAVKKFVDA